MRISILAPANSIHTAQWVSLLQARGHDLQLISLHRPATTDHLDRVAQLVQLRGRGHLGYVTAAPAARRAIDEFAPDVVHAHYASGYGTLGRLVRRHPYVVSVWGSDVYEFPERSPLRRRLLVGNLRAADAVTATSAALKRRTEDTTADSLDVTVVPFGVDTVAFAPRSEEQVATGPLRVGTVKTLAPQYGVDDLLRSFAALPLDVRSRATLEVVGGGPLRDELGRLAARLNLRSTTFHGPVSHSDVPDHLRQLDVYVALSIVESFGVAIIEASACGLPVVVSDAGGLPEVVRDGITGFVVPQRDTTLAAQRIAQLLTDPALRAKMGRAGRDHVIARYTWAQCAAGMEHVYRSVVQRRAAA